MKIVLLTLDLFFQIIFLLFKIIAVIILIAYLSSCYEYRKVPNIKRVKKREVRKAMKYSTSDYQTYRPSINYNTQK